VPEILLARFSGRSSALGGFGHVLDTVERYAGDVRTLEGRGAHVAYCFAPTPDAADTALPGDDDRWSEALAWIEPDEPAPPPQSAAEPEVEATPPELAITSDLTAVELRRLRRQFALKFHPDRLDPSHREAAAARMSSVNALIDSALKSKRA
jgi:hypothetical protein